MIKNFTVHRYENMEIEYCRPSDVFNQELYYLFPK